MFSGSAPGCLDPPVPFSPSAPHHERAGLVCAAKEFATPGSPWRGGAGRCCLNSVSGLGADTSKRDNGICQHHKNMSIPRGRLIQLIWGPTTRKIVSIFKTNSRRIWFPKWYLYNNFQDQINLQLKKKRICCAPPAIHLHTPTPTLSHTHRYTNYTPHRSPKVQSVWHHVGRNGCVSKASAKSVSEHLFIPPTASQNHCVEFTALKM